MRGKEAIALVILLVLLASAVIAVEPWETTTAISWQEIQARNLEIVQNDSKDIPMPVRIALQDYLREAKAEQEQMETARFELVRREKTQKILFSAGIGVSMVILFIILFFIIHNRVIPRLKRRIRRQSLFLSIIKYGKKGLSGKEIMRLLVIKGWNKHHVEDALSRYREFQDIEKGGMESDLNLLRGNRKVQASIRRARRQYMFFRLMLLTKLWRKDLKEAKKRLIKRGWNAMYVDDAYVRYKAYLHEKKSIFAIILNRLLGSGLSHRIRRKIRRQVLYPKIRRLMKKGMDHKQIVKELGNKGWQEKHVMDVYVRYRGFLERKNIPKPEALIWGIWPLGMIRRRIRRQILFLKIRKLKKKRISDKDILRHLARKGWQEKHADDALYLYNIYVRVRKG